MKYQNADQQVIGFVLENLAANRTAWLCTVLSTWGSSPRPKGSLFAFNEQGAKAGSLSGGCVEEDLVERTLRNYSGPEVGPGASHCEVIVFGATAEEAGRLRLPCGGQLRVAVECLAGDDQRLDASQRTARTRLFEQVAQSLEAQVPVIREVAVEHYQWRLVPGAELEAQQREALTALSIVEQDNRFLHFLGPTYTLLLIGVSEVSKAVAMMANLLDYHVILCDPRAEVLKEWDIEGVTIIQGMPDDVIRELGPLNYTAILALTHDPRIDDMGLMEALTTDAFYIGAMGSERSSANRRERMLKLDISPEQLEALHAPIGVDIGSKTPAEIAVSILAEITRERRTRAQL
jgi:xanthine dehydrogenase accessory factor